MANSKALFHELEKKVRLNESQDEIRSMIYILMEHVLNVSRKDIMADKPITIGWKTNDRLSQYLERINNSEPIQYIIGEADFFGRKFKVNKHVLIPRPETEELVGLVKNIAKENNQTTTAILDIGTGSGCIPITLALEISKAKIYATDISEPALEIATLNADTLRGSVAFLKHNILEEDLPFKDLDIIISNPPYVTLKEKSDMRRNVIDYEPHLALFVSDDDPLLFYGAIATRSMQALKHGGCVAVEINEHFGKETAAVFDRSGYIDIAIIKDIFGKDRIVKASKPL